MKNLIIMVVIIFGAMIASSFNVNAQDNPVIDTFNYQGELVDDGVPANGEYDFTIRAESTSQGPVGLTSEHTVSVVNGLFLLEEVDLGANRFSDGTELFLRVSVRKTSVGGAYEALSPPQLLTAVPFASQLIAGDATSDQVLTFDGNSWQPQDAAEQYWALDTSVLSFNGGTGAAISILENGSARGFMGSVGNGIGPNDLAVGATLNDLHLIAGAFSTPSVTLTASNGDTTINGDAKQPVTSNGMMKFMASVENCGNAAVSLVKSYNGIDGGQLVALNAGNTACSIIVPNAVDITNRYIMAHVTGNSSNGRMVSCEHSGASGINCTIFTTANSKTIGNIDILLY